MFSNFCRGFGLSCHQNAQQEFFEPATKLKYFLLSTFLCVTKSIDNLYELCRLSGRHHSNHYVIFKAISSQTDIRVHNIPFHAMCSTGNWFKAQVAVNYKCWKINLLWWIMFFFRFFFSFSQRVLQEGEEGFWSRVTVGSRPNIFPMCLFENSHSDALWGRRNGGCRDVTWCWFWACLLKMIRNNISQRRTSVFYLL